MGLSVSVAMCTHNGEAFVERQLESILRSNLVPEQIVVSDDASSDSTRTIVDRVTGRHPSVDVILLDNQTPLGVTANFAQAISACTGDVIALSDQDDEWHPDRLARVIPLFDASPSLSLIFSNARLVDAAGVPIGYSLFEALEVTPRDLEELRDDRAFSRLLRRNLVTGATTAFRRSLLSAALPIPYPWLHDEWLAVIAATLGAVGVVEEDLVDYRQHGSNEIGARRPTLRHKLGRLVGPRADRNRLLALRFAVLAERLDSLPTASPADLQRTSAKSAFESARAALPSARLSRIPQIVGFARKSWYRDYSSQGSLDMARDLLQAP